MSRFDANMPRLTAAAIEVLRALVGSDGAGEITAAGRQELRTATQTALRVGLTWPLFVGSE